MNERLSGENAALSIVELPQQRGAFWSITCLTIRPTMHASKSFIHTGRH
ncbi:hypothetical protein [Pseudoalteromonas piscicida]|nr:hypothetical protein [Pseudoalteromonas piscicida]